MKKYKVIMTIVFILFYILWLYFSYNSLQKSREVYVGDINMSIVDIKDRVNININSIYKSSFKLWDLEINKILEERDNLKKEESIVSKTTNKSVSSFNLTKRKICLYKQCWEFMGIISIGQSIEVTLLSSDKKQKIETFTIGDELLKGLVIINIKEDSMIVKDSKKGKKFILKVFDINSSAYLPQKVKEKSHE